MDYDYGCNPSVSSFLPTGIARLPDALAFVRDWCKAINAYFTAADASGLNIWQPDLASALFKSAAGAICGADGHEYRLRRQFLS